MDDFARLLAYLADPKVEALLLQSDRSIAVRINGELAALSATPLADLALRRILYSSPLAPQIDALGQHPIDVPLSGPDGIELIATLSPYGEGLHCSISRSSTERPARRFSIPPSTNSVAHPTRRTLPPEAQAEVRQARPVIPPQANPRERRVTQPAPHGSPRRSTQPPAQGSGRRSTQPPGEPDSRRPTLPPTQGATRRITQPAPHGAPRASTQPPTRRTTQPQARGSAAAPNSKRSRPSIPTPGWSPRGRSAAQASPLHGWLQQGRDQGASDIHIVSDSPLLLRRMGKLERVGTQLDHDTVQRMLDEMLDGSAKEQYSARGYADFALDDERLGRFRVNVCRHKRGAKICLRVIPQDPPTLEQLDLPPELGAVLGHHQGLAVIAGPNGQGKSTTLAALVHKLNTEKAIHIITVEDPIEIVHPVGKAVITQRQVGRDTASFQSALKAALREDPDVIVLGELRDRETVEMALSAAETGHLVIATMNTPSGAKTIGRLIDLFPPDDQSQVRATLAGTLMAVAAQRLVPRADGSGMVPAVELITGGVALWSLIRDDKLVQLPGLMQRGKRMGMIQLETSLRELCTRGLISQSTLEETLNREKGAEASPASPPVPLRSDDTPASETTEQEDARSGLRGLFQRKTS